MFDNFIEKEGEIVDNSWVKWFHFAVPDNEGEEREENRDWLKGLNHCSKCTVLSGCYFIKYKLPQKKAEGKGLLHPNCDCKLLNIQKPTNQIIADCSIAKFTDYIFCEKYASNGKIKLFKSLGFNKEDSQYLKQEFDRQAKECYLNGDYELGVLNEHGQRINITIKLNTTTRESVSLVTGWMIRPLGKITCNTPLGG